MDLRFGISKPQNGTKNIPGPPKTFSVSGFAQIVGDANTGAEEILLDKVQVTFGRGGDVKAAELSGTTFNKSWKATGSVGRTAVGGHTVRVTAVATGRMLVPTHLPSAARIPGNGDGGTPHPAPHWEDFQQQASVVVTLEDKVLESVTIDEFTTPVTPETLPYRLNLTGTADDVSGVASVQVSLDDPKFKNPEDVDTHTVAGTTWKWAKTLELSAGQHQVRARATDTKGNSRPTAPKYIDVRQPFEPGPAEQAFEKTRYLFELGCGSSDWDGFAKRYVQVGDGSTELTPAALAQRLHQQYDRLTEPVAFEQATTPLPQARIAIEVLRAYITSPAPPELDQRFRDLAYQTLLVNLGTSYDELRLARTADPDSRQALAGRLGLGSLPDWPDRLDSLLLPPDSISDGQLETLFGYASTAPADPLNAPQLEAAVLLWQRTALASRWQDEDEAQRDGPDEALPIIDPDIIGEEHIRNADPDDPARLRWTQRRAWVAAKLAEIQQQAGTIADPAARFGQLVSDHIGALDVADLAARDAEGEDIGPELLAFELSLAAFRFLAHSRAALDGGQLLDTEWQDVFSILVQVGKRRQFRQWRQEERQDGLVLAPSSFTLGPPALAGPGSAGGTSSWRFTRSVYSAWLRTLQARGAQSDTLDTRYRQTLQATEAQVLPALRDALIAEIGDRRSESPQAAAERLTRELMIDLQNSSGEQTTRAGQAIETLQTVLFSARAGKLPAGQSDWTIKKDASGERNFDAEWAWMGSYPSWLAATRVFAYPDNQLLPALYTNAPPLDPPTNAFQGLIDSIRKQSRFTAETARQLAKAYLGKLREDSKNTLEDHLKDNKGKDTAFVLTDEYSDAELAEHHTWNHDLDPHQAQFRQQYHEVFWLVPMALAQRLQESRQFQAALDWYRTVYAYHLPPGNRPPGNRRIYQGLQLEEGISSSYDRVPEWMLKELNPHIFAQQRRNCYTRSTIMTIAGCLLAYGDAEFSQNTAETNARARTLYETALDLLNLDEAQPETPPQSPFLPNPVWRSLRQQAQTSLDKIHRGLNIAGAVTPDVTNGDTTLPSHYRYPALIERAKNLAGIAGQLEAAFLSVLEQRDAQAYDALQAAHDLQVARASLTIQDIKVTDAQTGVRLAGLQRERAEIQEDYYTRQIEDGLNGYEEAGIAGLSAAAFLQASAGTLYGIAAIHESLKATFTAGFFGGPAQEIAQALSSFAAAASTGAQISQTLASYERREQEWKLQRSLASTDAEIGGQQIKLAQDQLLLAGQERDIAGLQFDHARAVADFLATKFTNTELFEWMSGVLGRVYAYFLQQATALAQLAQAQLAFERQEPVAGFVQADYWRDTTTDNTPAPAGGAPDRQGMTGSARLLQDIYRLDEYAFDTNRRKLHLTQTLSLAQLAARELQQFRDTGVLTFATPEALFDRDFPGHYLRLIKQVKVSLIALIPPTRGVRATLSASGVSRTVAARGPFGTVTMRREPESIAFTSPVNATGLFELEPETGILLPFEGMGADTTWQLELPKAANPFDYRSIADVLLTIEYTALNSQEHRHEVIRSLGSSFSGDRTFSLRNQFPDAWYQLNNPDTVDDPQQRMRAVLPLTAEDFPPYIRDLAVAQLTLFAVRDDTLLGELTVPALRHTTTDGQTTEAGPVHTVDGAIGTRLPGGAPWQVFIGANPAGNWELQIDDSAQTRQWFTDGLIDDLALVFTLTGTTPPW